MPYPSAVLAAMKPDRVLGSITSDTISNSATTVFDLQDAIELPTPVGLAVAAQGTTGATSWGYQVAAHGPGGLYTAAAAEVTIANGHATPGTTNYNRIIWVEVEGAEAYDVWRTTAGGTPNTTGRIKTVYRSEVHTTAGYMVCNDTGLAIVDASSAPATNTSAAVKRGLPKYIYVENTGANPLLVFFPPTRTPNSTVAGVWGDDILSASVSAGTFTKRFSIPAGGSRVFSQTVGFRWATMRGSGGTTNAYLEVA